jgi:hypothetical protein
MDSDGFGRIPDRECNRRVVCLAKQERSGSGVGVGRTPQDQKVCEISRLVLHYNMAGKKGDRLAIAALSNTPAPADELLARDYCTALLLLLLLQYINITILPLAAYLAKPQ